MGSALIRTKYSRGLEDIINIEKKRENTKTCVSQPFSLKYLFITILLIPVFPPNDILNSPCRQNQSVKSLWRPRQRLAKGNKFDLRPETHKDGSHLKQ